MAHDHNFPIAAILEKEKLHESGTNFVDWFHNVRIVLKDAKKDYVLVETLGDPPVEEATLGAKELYQQHVDDYVIVQCALLASMEPELQKRFENLTPDDGC
jgi:uncharacterized protein YeeX (DUF496 family)